MCVLDCWTRIKEVSERWPSTHEVQPRQGGGRAGRQERRGDRGGKGVEGLEIRVEGILGTDLFELLPVENA